jgi:hypothetical protein
MLLVLPLCALQIRGTAHGMLNIPLLIGPISKCGAAVPDTAYGTLIPLQQRMQQGALCCHDICCSHAPQQPLAHMAPALDQYAAQMPAVRGACMMYSNM